MSSSEEEEIVSHQRQHEWPKHGGKRGLTVGDDEELEGNVVFVVNLPFTTRWQELKDAFKHLGEVKFADLIAGADGRPRGSAMITFETNEAATAAIETMNGFELGGRKITVRTFEGGPRPRLLRGNQGVPQQSRFKRNKNKEDTSGDGGDDNGEDDDDDGQPHHHQQRGRGAGAGAGGRGRGRGRGAGPSSAAGVDVPKPRSQQAAERTVFVTNLPFECTWHTLKQTFEQVGKVVRADIIMEGNRSRGMGTVEFVFANDAMAAIDEFDGIEMGGRAMKVRMGRGQF